jgi:galactokinase
VTYVDPGDPSEIARSVRAGFADRYGAEPSAVGRAPGRVNLMGEHTDYNHGLVLPVALPHATYAAARLRDDSSDGLVRIASAQLPDPWEGPLAAIGPGTVDGWAAYAAGVVWALHEQGHQIPGVDLFVDSTVPLGAGLSSSAALECSVGVAIAGALGLPLTTGLRHELVAAGTRAETEIVGAPTGGMDQTVAMLGQAGAALLIDFDVPDEQDRSTPVPLALAGHSLLVTDTRVSHALVDGGYGQRRADCEEAAAALGVSSLRHADLDAVSALADDRVRRRARHVVTEIVRVRECVAAVGAGDLDTVGTLFAASHLSMRDDFEISCPELDVAVAVAVEAGAVAARMTGGGFGGSSVAVVPDDRVDAVTRAIDTAFVLEGFAAPGHLRAEPSPGASLVQSR